MRAKLLLADDRCEVILTTHHSIADGMAIMYVIRDLLQAVSGEKLAPLPAPPPQDELLAPLLRTLPSRMSEQEASTVPVSRPTAFRRKDGARPRVTALLAGAVSYPLMHVFESWTRYDSPYHAAVSIIFVLLTFFPAGVMKSFLTFRTGNAWVHMWAFHAITPHVMVDTRLVVHDFNIR
jgi:hypothetical protein